MPLSDLNCRGQGLIQLGLGLHSDLFDFKVHVHRSANKTNLPLTASPSCRLVYCFDLFLLHSG